jgi:hypothetical protein
MKQLRSDLDRSALDFIGLEERGIWQTPPDQPFVDGQLFLFSLSNLSDVLLVLSTKKDAAENKNRKDYVTEKWEQEVRESLAKKKAATVGGNLSKQDKALVAAQLAKEAEIRRRIAMQQAKLKRGAALISSLVASSAEIMERHVGEMAHLLLVTAFGAGSFLLNGRPFEVFLVSSRYQESQNLMSSSSKWAISRLRDLESTGGCWSLPFSDHPTPRS